MRSKEQDQKAGVRDLFQQVPRERISGIVEEYEKLIWRALQEGRKERDAAATALQPSSSRVLRIFFK